MQRILNDINSNSIFFVDFLRRVISPSMFFTRYNKNAISIYAIMVYTIFLNFPCTISIVHHLQALATVCFGKRNILIGICFLILFYAYPDFSQKIWQ